MRFSHKLRNPIWNISRNQLRHFCNVVQELTVQTFCDVQVNVPYNVRIQPLDIHKYHNCDLLRLELQGAAGRSTVKHLQDGNNIRIYASTQDYDQYATCLIQAPVKANLNINACGNIHAGVFSGSKLILKSRKGNIYAKKFQGDTFDVITENGDIFLTGSVVASNISAIARQTGSIKTKRIQGINAVLKTNEGSISVDSSYCDNSIFEASSGDLNLQNVHKRSKVVLKNGNLNLSGLDGHLDAELCDATAEIQISRILEDSTIIMNGKGELKLMVSEDCQENTLFEILSKGHTLNPSIKLIPSQNDTTLYLAPTNMDDKSKSVYVECKEGLVHIESSSWINMLKLDVKK